MDHVQTGEVGHALSDPEHKLIFELEGRRSLANARLQKREQRAVFTKLQHQDVRIAGRAHANERHDVRVVELRHQRSLGHKRALFHDGGGRLQHLKRNDNEKKKN